MAGQTATIVGVNGGFGRLFAGQLAAAGWTVRGLDRVPDVLEPDHCSTYFHLAEDSPRHVPEDFFAGSDLVLLCTPSQATFEWTDFLADFLEEGTLCADILSVKEGICEHAAELGFAGEYLSLHPMFAPSAGFAGQAVAAIAVQGGPLMRAFLDLVESWGGRIVPMDAETHDRTTAILQVGVHGALLALGRAMWEASADPRLLKELATPVSGPVLAALERVLQGNPETYQAIQDENRYAEITRLTMVRAIQELKHDHNVGWLFKQLR